MESFVSDGWKKLYDHIKTENVEKLFNSKILGTALPLELRGDFIEKAKHYRPAEYARIMKTWKEHPILERDPAPYAIQRYNMRIHRCTAYYIMMVSWLLGYFPDIKNWSVIEVGAGLGGLARILFLTEPTLKHYSIIDFDIMLGLAKRILSDHANVTYCDTRQPPYAIKDKQNLFVSTVCLSETTPDFLNYLAKNVWPLCDNFFIIDTRNLSNWSNKIIVSYLMENGYQHEVRRMSIRNQLVITARRK